MAQNLWENTEGEEDYPELLHRAGAWGNTEERKARMGRIEKGASVFISYSHQDQEWLEQFQRCLTPYRWAGSITAWSDKQIAPGSSWHQDIQQAIAQAQVAVLLVTKEFLASEYIHEHEFGPILAKAHQNQVRILWIPIKPSPFHKTPLKDLQAMISPAEPLAERSPTEQDAAWVEICDEIERSLNPR